MGDNVKGQTDRESRVYDTSGRRASAAARRRSILSAAEELLEQHGYVATTIVAVAQRAGVSSESVYKGFGTKAALIKAVFDVVIGGDDDPVPVAERPEMQRIRTESDVRRKLELFAEGAAIRAERSARIQLVLRNGAAADPAIGELWRSIQSERLLGMTGFATHLLSTDRLREGVGLEEVRDVLWTCVSVEVYDLFVLQRLWTREAYADWLTRTLVTSLCPDP